jgi:sugar/nucleoside kinase (ribokinase family)
MTSSVDAVVSGHICLDVHPDLSGADREPFEKIFHPGHLLASGPVSFATGGTVANTGLALHRLGVTTRLVGKVGDDLFGRTICQIIDSYSKDLTYGIIVDPSGNTSYSIIINYPGVDRIILHCPGMNDTFQINDVPYESLREARLFHFGYPPLMRSTFADDGATLAEIFLRAKQTEVTTSLDMAFPDPGSAAGRADWRSILKSVLPHVDIFMPSVEEILFMLRRQTYEQLCATTSDSNILPLIAPALLSELSQELIEMGVPLVGVKLGYRGLYLRSGNSRLIQSIGRACPSNPEAWASKELWSPCFKVRVAGTTGSGDATIAGFLAALLHDLSIEESLKIAVAVGASNVEAVDTLSGIRSWETTQARVDAGWEKHVLELNSPGWHFDSRHGFWNGPCT